MNSQEDTYASSLAKLNNEEVMLGSKKREYKQKLISKMEKMVDDAWNTYLIADASRPNIPKDELNEIYCIYLTTCRVRDTLKLSKK